MFKIVVFWCGLVALTSAPARANSYPDWTARDLAIAAKNSSEYPLAGIWKVSCSDGHGLAIAPAHSGLYSISFCGPGGCFKPGTYRDNSKISGDRGYWIYGKHSLGVSTEGGGYSRYVRCEGEKSLEDK